MDGADRIGEPRYATRPELQASEGEFTIVLLPDTQWYTVSGDFWFTPAKGRPRMTRDGPETFYAQTRWIAENRDRWNIVYVAQVGDLIESHGEDINELEIASRAMRTIENAVDSGRPDGIPYGISVGNHEQATAWASRVEATTVFNKYFGIKRFQGRNYYSGHYGGDNDNHYDLFRAGDLKFVVIHLECVRGLSPDSPTIRWARQVLRDHAHRQAIVVAHYLLDKQLRLSPFGRAIYHGLRDEPNLFLMLCGHTEAEAHRTFRREGLRPVHIVMADYSHRSHDDEISRIESWQGGNGWMQLLKFVPSKNQIHAYTFSPTMSEGQFDLTSRHGQFETDADSEFILEANFTLNAAEVPGHEGAKSLRHVVR
jgi:hypothetical protein